MTARSRRSLLLLAVVSAAACSNDWDLYDPRLGEGGAGGSAVGAGDPGGGGQGTGASGTGGAGTGGGGTGGATGGGSVGGAGGGSVQLSYPATVADCIAPTNPNPDACAAENGGTRMTIDSQVDPMTGARHAFVRFDLDDAFAGLTIDAVELRLRVPMFMGSEADQSGEVWTVTPFARADLFVAPPAKVGMAPIAPNQGAVTLGQVVTFDLPTSLATANATVSLGLYPLSTNGVDYFNTLGSDPPELVVTAH